MAMVRRFDVILGQTLNHSVYNFVIMCNVMHLLIIEIIIIIIIIIIFYTTHLQLS
jgi:hypothetical protein